MTCWRCDRRRYHCAYVQHCDRPLRYRFGERRYCAYHWYQTWIPDRADYRRQDYAL